MNDSGVIPGGRDALPFFVEKDNDDTAAMASIDDVADVTARVDAQVRAVLRRVMAQRRSAETAFAYAKVVSRGVRANCTDIAEAAGHETASPVQNLLGRYSWDYQDLRAELPALAAGWLICDPDDLIGPGAAIDETADLKSGDMTACVSPQHAGVTGKVENCVTWVFSSYVTTRDHAWVDFDLYMPQRWADDPGRREQAGIPGDLQFATKPELAARQVTRMLDAGLPLQWAAFDEVYGRSGALRDACRAAGLSYAGIIPCTWSITLPSGAVITAQDAIADAVFERRPCGYGSKGPRYSYWALTATADPGEHLLIRESIAVPGLYTFYLCHAAEGRPATLTYFVTIAGRRWPVEETFKTGKNVLSWDQSQVRSYQGLCRHTALTALAQLRAIGHRAALTGQIILPEPAGDEPPAPGPAPVREPHEADLLIPLGDAPLPSRGGQPCPPGIGAIRLSVAETARLVRLAEDYTAGRTGRARLAFALRWSLRRRRHQARARWHHYSRRLLPALA
jgi:hypothetical protein